MRNLFDVMNTILYKCIKNMVEVPKDIAGLMVSAIVSDTLLFKSPTALNKILKQQPI